MPENQAKESRYKTRKHERPKQKSNRLGEGYRQRCEHEFTCSRYDRGKNGDDGKDGQAQDAKGPEARNPSDVRRGHLGSQKSEQMKTARTVMQPTWTEHVAYAKWCKHCGSQARGNVNDGKMGQDIFEWLQELGCGKIIMKSDGEPSISLKRSKP